MGGSGGASFAIKSPDSLFIVAGGAVFLGRWSLLRSSELRGRISYARHCLRADRLVVEGDSTSVISWLRKQGVFPTHLFVILGSC